MSLSVSVLESKNYGACMGHGHYHSNIDEYNLRTSDLRVDVGIDGKLARECGGIIPLEKLYEYFWDITQNDNFARYVAENRDRNPI